MARARFNAKILNVNADALIRRITTEILRQAGFEVCEASKGSEALLAAFEARLDVMLVAIQLPDISGSEICRRVKEDPATASIMVIQTSAKCASADRVDALETGADALIVEPLDTDELIATINALVKIRWCREQLCERVDELERELRALNPRRPPPALDSKTRRINGS